MASDDYFRNLKFDYLRGNNSMFLNSNYGFLQNMPLSDDEDEEDENKEMKGDDNEEEEETKKDKKNLINAPEDISDTIMDGLNFAGNLMQKQDGSQNDMARASNVIHGAVQGAKFGSNFGPIGTAVGAAAGGLTKFFQGKKAKEGYLKKLNDDYGNQLKMKERNREMMYESSIKSDRLRKQLDLGKIQLNYG